MNVLGFSLPPRIRKLVVAINCIGTIYQFQRTSRAVAKRIKERAPSPDVEVIIQQRARAEDPSQSWPDLDTNITPFGAETENDRRLRDLEYYSDVMTVWPDSD